MAVDLDGLEEKIAIVMEKKAGEFSQNAIGLKDAGYVIIYASSGRDALLKLEASHYRTNIPTQNLVFLSHGFESGLVGPTKESGIYSDSYEQQQIINNMTEIEYNEEYEVSSVTHRNYDEARELLHSQYPTAVTVSEIAAMVDAGKIMLTEDVTIAIGGCNAGINCSAQVLYDTPESLDSDGLELLDQPGNFARDLSTALNATVLSATKPVRNGVLLNEGGQTNPGTGNTTYRSSASDSWYIFNPDGTSQSTGNSKQNLDLSDDDKN